MSTRPRLTRNVPFWILIVGSIASAVAGAYLLVDKLSVMATALTDQTATGVEVYVGQIWAVLGAVLIGAGIVGLALALTIAALRSFVPAAPAAVAEPIDWSAESAPAQSAPVESAPAQPAPVESAPVESAPAAAEPTVHDGPATPLR
jgi:hypothetical protein